MRSGFYSTGGNGRRRGLPAILLCLSLLPAATAYPASARIVFDRMLPAPHNLGTARDVAIINAPSGEPLIDLFVEELVHHANRSGALVLRDARTTTGPAEAHLDVKSFRCTTQTQESMRDDRRVYQVAALCTARVEVLSQIGRAHV